MVTAKSTASAAGGSAGASTSAKIAASPSNQNKRKSMSMSTDGSDDEDELKQPQPKLTSTGKVSASQQLVPVPGNPDAPLVTKRTLQNRKAQREFRKRREARVKDLEERVRRYDEQGVEANLALQQIAESLKQENEALKGLLVRLGFANMIGPTIDAARGQPPVSFGPPPHSYPAMDLSMASWAQGSDATTTTHASYPTSTAPAPSKRAKTSGSGSRSQKQSSTLTTRPQAHAAPPPSTSVIAASGSVNPSLLSEAPRSTTSTATAAVADSSGKKDTDDGGPFNNDWFAQLAQAGHGKDDDDEGDTTKESTERSQGHAALAIPVTRDTSTAELQGQKPDAPATINPILSLSFGDDKRQQSQGGKGRETQQQQLGKPTARLLSPRVNDLTPNTALRNFFSDFTPSSAFNNNGNNNGASGSAMLGESSNGPRSFGMPGMGQSGSGSNIFPMPLPTHQNDALLNPNPIPFAFNLSNPRSPPDQSWWNQMGGGQFTDGDSSILDEKAQAVAQATAALNNGGSGNGAQSPFDLSAFLTGGITPGGGFNLLGPHAAPGSNNESAAFGTDPSADDSTGKLKGVDNGKEDPLVKFNPNLTSSDTANTTNKALTPAEHAQMFLRLLEAKMAQQSTSPYTSLGFQPPSQTLLQQPSPQPPHRTSGPPQPWSDDEGARSSPSSSPDNVEQRNPSPLAINLPASSPSLSPLNVYTRLSQHPAFLSTDASELEELVDTIGQGQQQQQQQSQQQSQQQQRKAGNGTLLYPVSAAGLTPSLYTAAAGNPLAKAGHATAAAAKLAPSVDANGEVGVDEKTLDKMLGFLDQRTPRAAV